MKVFLCIFSLALLSSSALLAMNQQIVPAAIQPSSSSQASPKPKLTQQVKRKTARKPRAKIKPHIPQEPALSPENFLDGSFMMELEDRELFALRSTLFTQASDFIKKDQRYYSPEMQQAADETFKKIVDAFGGDVKRATEFTCGLHAVTSFKLKSSDAVRPWKINYEHNKEAVIPFTTAMQQIVDAHHVEEQACSQEVTALQEKLNHLTQALNEKTKQLFLKQREGFFQTQCLQLGKNMSPHHEKFVKKDQATLEQEKKVYSEKAQQTHSQLSKLLIENNPDAANPQSKNNLEQEKAKCETEVKSKDSLLGELSYELPNIHKPRSTVRSWWKGY